jgi:ABC-type lipoprotein release transport system permease subunit
MSLGALRADVLRAIGAQGLRLSVIGCAVGLVVGALLARVLSGLLVGVSPWDPVTFGAVTGILAGVTALATYLPARRAMAVDPLRALREP